MKSNTVSKASAVFHPSAKTKTKLIGFSAHVVPYHNLLFGVAISTTQTEPCK